MVLLHWPKYNTTGTYPDMMALAAIYCYPEAKTSVEWLDPADDLSDDPRYLDALEAHHTAEMQRVFAERNLCVSLLVKMALALGLVAGIGVDPDETDEQWKHVAFIDLPSGQVSWHIKSDELPLFLALPRYDSPYDGHDTQEKYRRVRDPKLTRYVTL